MFIRLYSLAFPSLSLTVVSQMAAVVTIDSYAPDRPSIVDQPGALSWNYAEFKPELPPPPRLDNDDESPLVPSWMFDEPKKKHPNVLSADDRLSRRRRSIACVKITPKYKRYRLKVRKCDRRCGDPQTPRINPNRSKRAWLGQIAKWQKALHIWCEDFDDDDTATETQLA